MTTVGFFPMIADERQMIVQDCKSTAIIALEMFRREVGEGCRFKFKTATL
jgi:hypothetical protein